MDLIVMLIEKSNMSDIYTTKPAKIFNLYGKHPDSLTVGNNTDPGIFSMIPHFFFEFFNDF